MSTIRYSDAASNAMLDSGLVAYINTGAGAPEIEYYNGTMPATGDTAITTQVLLATLPCSDPWEAGAAASRSVAADTITGANAVRPRVWPGASGKYRWQTAEAGTRTCSSALAHMGAPVGFSR